MKASRTEETAGNIWLSLVQDGEGEDERIRGLFINPGIADITA